MQNDLPAEFDEIRDKARRALGPLKDATKGTQAPKDLLFTATRTEAGRKLPEPYLVYLVLVELLGFTDLGQFEKLAWSIPVDLNGTAYLIEHRKFGVGVFAAESDNVEAEATKIVNHVHKAVKAAKHFLDWLAIKAVEQSDVNVANKSAALFKRFEYLRDSCQAKVKEAHDRREECVVTKGKSKGGGSWQSFSYPANQIHQEGQWLGLSAVEAFFSWTEHVFIHLSIITGRVGAAEEVANLAQSDWASKFKAALDITNPAAKKHFDKLADVRRDLRNFMAHGAFGKQGEAFSFHSVVGAVPVLLPDLIGSRNFSFGQIVEIDVDQVLSLIGEFVSFVWDGALAPAKIYIQDWEHPLIMTLARDGTYAKAMASSKKMEKLCKDLAHRMDDAANMDW